MCIILFLHFYTTPKFYLTDIKKKSNFFLYGCDTKSGSLFLFLCCTGGAGAFKSFGRGELSSLCGCFWPGGLLSGAAKPYLANSCWGGGRQVHTSGLSLPNQLVSAIIVLKWASLWDYSLYFIWFYRIWIIRKKHVKEFKSVHQPHPVHTPPPHTHTHVVPQSSCSSLIITSPPPPPPPLLPYPTSQRPSSMLSLAHQSSPPFTMP